jgi:hypothetical protein
MGVEGDTVVAESFDLLEDVEPEGWDWETELFDPSAGVANFMPLRNLPGGILQSRASHARHGSKASVRPK